MKKNYLLKPLVTKGIIFTLVILLICGSPSFAIASTSVSKVTVNYCRDMYNPTTMCPKIELGWSRVKGVTGYQVYFGVGYDKNNIKYKKIATTTRTTYKVNVVNDEYRPQERQFTVSNGDYDCYYNYKVRAYKIINGENYYGKFSAIKSTYILDSTYDGQSAYIAYMMLSYELKYPDTLKIHTVYLGPAQVFDKGSNEYLKREEAGAYQQLGRTIYVEYTAKNDLNMDVRGWIRVDVYPLKSDLTKFQPFISHPSGVPSSLEMTLNHIAVFKANKYIKVMQPIN